MIKKLLFSIVAIFTLAYLLPGVTVTALGAVVLAIVLGVINMFIRPVLFLLTLPLTIVTFGLFALVLNVFLVMLAAYVVPDVTIVDFWTALLFSIGLSVLVTFFDAVFKTERALVR